VELDPTFFLNYLFLGWTSEAKGLNADAITHLQKAMSLPGGATAEVMASLGHAYALAGATAKALEMLQMLQRRQQASTYVDPYNFAMIYAGLNNPGEAFKWLESAYKQHSEGITFIAVDPRLNPLRSDSRFAKLAQAIGLPG